MLRQPQPLPFLSICLWKTLPSKQILRPPVQGHRNHIWRSYNYYVHEEAIVSNDGKGVGPFVTASVEIHKLNQP
ncbi:hypothetical protein HQ585_00680 [candidate division KSB1 bacterium]|nr:hypothetical protein [candidate division KSB1 bacterium]